MSEMIVVYDLLPEIADRLERGVSAAVRKTAFDIQRTAQTIAPVDTGFLKNSIYVVTHNKSNYETRMDRARSKNPDAEELPEVTPPDNPMEAIVAVGAAYGIYVEYGSLHGPARPYLTPAADMAMPVLQAALNVIATQLALTGPIGANLDVGEE